MRTTAFASKDKPTQTARVGLMGGSFNPVHVAHVQLAQTALTTLSLEQVRWLPAGQPWQKTTASGAAALLPAAQRLAMVQLAIAHESRFVLDTTELQRAGPSYTLDTLQALQAANPQVAQWFLIIGQDQYARFDTWHGWPHILQRVTLAVACRGDAPAATPVALQQVPHRWVTLPMPPAHISSTDIRQHLARGQSALSLAPKVLDEAVARYIDTHQLYAPKAAH